MRKETLASTGVRDRPGGCNDEMGELKCAGDGISRLIPAAGYENDLHAVIVRLPKASARDLAEVPFAVEDGSVQIQRQEPDGHYFFGAPVRFISSSARLRSSSLVPASPSFPSEVSFR